MDLEYLVSVTNGSVTKADGEYWLQTMELDALPTIDGVNQPAERILGKMNALARLSRADAQPVKGTFVQGTDESGKWCRTTRLYGTLDITIVSSLQVPLKVGDRELRLADSDPAVRAVVQDLSGKRDFATARRIGETVLLDMGNSDSRRGVEAIVSRGWATRAECTRFQDSVNLGDGKSVGTHSQLAGPPVTGAMSVGQAWDFLRVLLGKWLASK